MPVQTRSLLEIIEALPDSSTLLLHEVSWAYEKLLALLPDNPRFRLGYDQGTLEMMTLSPRHERLKALFAPHMPSRLWLRRPLISPLRT